MNNPIIPYAKHEITEDDIKSVVDTLRAGFLSGGPRVAEFEKEFATYVGGTHALAVSSGTAGLHLAVRALSGEAGAKKILVPSLTFAASANAALYVGMSVEFVDIDPDTLLMNLGDVEEKLKRDPEAYAGVVAVDFAGMPTDIKALSEICKKYGIWLIEDAAHSLGGVNNYDEPFRVGGSAYADATVFSFHPAKHITTGEGGMVVTERQDVHDKIKLSRSHSMDKNTPMAEQQGWYYEIAEMGYNYRMSDINAALGVSQLARIDDIIDRRHEIAKIYDENLSSDKLVLPYHDDKRSHAYHLYIVRVDDRLGVYNKLKEAGIFAQIHYVPLHLQPFYRNLVGEVSLPHTEKYYDHCLSIPMYPTLTEEEQQRVIETINWLV